jgi:hypothetical protein
VFLLKNFDLAVKRAGALIAHTPLDSRSWLELGQASLEVNDVRRCIERLHEGCVPSDTSGFPTAAASVSGRDVGGIVMACS